MGIFVSLKIIPNNISQSDWASVYKESLQLLSAYPFMDKIVIKDKYESSWIYMDKATSRKLTPWLNETGWYVLGDMVTGASAESFFLIDNIDYYHDTDDIEKSGDILLSTIEWQDEIDPEISKLSYSDKTVFDSKTQGHDYHKYILAMACLIESRFPDSAVVTGDITIGQMKDAIAWANTKLERAITLTIRANPEKLLLRLKSTLKTESALLQSMILLNLTHKNRDLGDLLIKNISKKVLKEYFIINFSNYSPGTIGYYSAINDYLNLGFDLETLCEICVLDETGCCNNEDEFTESVFNSGLGSNKFCNNNPESSKPDTIGSMLGKTLFTLAFGTDQSTAVYLPLEDIIAIFTEKFKKPENYYQPFIDEYSVNNNEYLAGLDSDEPGIMEKPEFDVYNLDDLYQWKATSKIYPNVQKLLDVLRSFMDELAEDKDFHGFLELSDKGKMDRMIIQNKYFSIKKDIWDYIEENLNNDQVILRIYRLLMVKADEMNISKLCKMVFWNQELLESIVIKNQNFIN